MDSVTSRFDEVVHDFWEPHPRPTSASLAAISARLRLTIPLELAQLANHSSRFSNIFLGLGENDDAYNHIIPYNRYWKSRRRTRRLPADLVIITNGFMDEDFWCLVRPTEASASSPSTQQAVEYWSPAPIGYPKAGHRGPRYETFAQFLDMLIEHYRQGK